MCGIVGLVSIDNDAPSRFRKFDESVSALNHRGPDAQGIINYDYAVLGHTRLSIIDVDPRSNQPMTDPTGRYTLIFNGEIYNYSTLREECVTNGFEFKTSSDTEVLLYQFMLHGKKCLDKLNGFFAFAVIDREEKRLTVVRDRLGIKPLVFFANETNFAFASELKALYNMGFEKKIDRVSVFTYFKLTYIPAPATILQNYYKLEPGCLVEINLNNNTVHHDIQRWYSVPYDPIAEKELNAHDYKQSQKVLKRFVRESVRRRLVSDVPVGTFLSGGIDSSIITAIAKQEKEDIEAFSIGFPDHKFYDESNAATTVASHLGLRHHLIEVRELDLLESASSFLNHIDEPFGDSSILNVNVLSKHVRKSIKVALSGDGGDELFGGYNKHQAEFHIRNPRIKEHIAGNLAPLWNAFPASRSGRIANLTRQLQKFSEGYGMNRRDRYWRWAGFMTEERVNYLMQEEMLEREQRLSDQGYIYKKRKDQLLRNITKEGSMNESLLTDTQMVLPNDMLFKVDYASMMNSLEVRTPMLDQHVVKFAFRLPIMFKVNHHMKKKILQDTFRDMLPAEVFSRPKKGFEVPMLEWFNGHLKAQLMESIEDRDFLQQQGIFNPSALDEYARKLYSSNPGDSASWAWSYLVFQNWFKRTM